MYEILTPVFSGEGGERESGCFPRLPVAAQTDQTSSELVGRSRRHGAGRHSANDAAEPGDVIIEDVGGSREL